MRYVHNAIEMWTSYGAATSTAAGHARFDLPMLTRVILRRPHERLDGLLPESAPFTLEDSWGTRQILESDVGRKRMPVMDRPPGRIEVFTPPGATIVQATGEDELAQAERIIVDGFPQPVHQPWERGKSLPPRLLRTPGWRIWLACHDGAPAAAGFTYDDGANVGVYWLATLPEHRGRGLARALMTRSLAAHRDRAATLVATADGEPLYRSLGFVTVSTATWYFRGRKD